MDAKLQGLVEQLQELIDGTAFRGVRAYLLDPGSDIDLVLVVNQPHSLAEVAAQLCDSSERRALDQGEFDTLVGEGKISLVILPGAEPKRNKQHTIPISMIPDGHWCQVLFLPPAYVIQFDEPLPVQQGSSA